MGIKEHLAKTEEKDLKLSDLQLRVEEDGIQKFDLERDISSDDWEAVKKGLEEMREDVLNRHDVIGGVLMWTKILSEEKAQELVEPDDFYIVNNNLRRMRSWFVFARGLAALRKLFPDKFDEVNFHDRDVDEMRREWTAYPFRDNHIQAKYLAEVKMALPDRFQELFELDDEFEDRLLEQVKVYRRDGKWKEFLHEAAHYRILYPDNTGKLDLDKEAWKNMRIAQENPNSSRKYVKVRDAGYLKILAADEVRFGDEGIELVMVGKDFKQEKKQRPERKKF